MKKSTIWILTVIMVITFAGLLYIQVLYMKNVVTMRNEQFSEGVKRSLYAVSRDLELEEARYYLMEDIEEYNGSSAGSYTPGSQLAFPPSGTIMPSGAMTLEYGASTDDRNVDMSITPRRTVMERIRDQYLYNRGLLDEVVLNIISQSSTRSIEERADSANVSQMLHEELTANGVTLPFEFALVNRMGSVVYKTQGFDVNITDENSLFVQAIFPGDNRSRVSYIKVYFPDKRDFIYHSIKFMVPAFFLTILLLIVFLYTIILAFRQKKLTEMKNDFINNMTHEFKTPISSISLAAQMLNDNTVRKSPKMLEHISTVINDETKRLRFQVEKVLQMSMFDRQKATLRIQDVDANLAISGIVNTFKLKVEKYGGSIEADLDAEDAIIEVDEMHFTNVIFNLLDNAVKYRKDDEPLRLRITTRDLSADRLEISIADNGIGIRKDDLKRVFEKFYRVSTGNRHDVKGFGLGLAYVKKMIREFGGDITAESDFGKGTKFIIILPLTKI